MTDEDHTHAVFPLKGLLTKPEVARFGASLTKPTRRREARDRIRLAWEIIRHGEHRY